MDAALTDLIAELLRREQRDQEVRHRAARAPGAPIDPDVAGEMRRIDADNAAWLRKVIEEYGWPGRSLVGAGGAHAAWLLAQHAPQDLQDECLPLLEQAVEAGEAERRNWAYLLDRVLMRRGEPQVYGTQFIIRDGRAEPHEIRDIETLDERRSAVGMEPFADYSKHFVGG